MAGGAIFHSDEGSQYTSRVLLDWAQESDVRLSCSRTGNCHDNAVAESFFATLKNETCYRQSFSARDEAPCANAGAVASHLGDYPAGLVLHASLLQLIKVLDVAEREVVL